MNKYFLHFVAMVILMGACSGPGISKDQVPSVVLNAVKASYPSANNVEWEKHQKLYEAEFNIDDSTEVAARIDESGILIMQKQDVALSELHSMAVAVLQDQYEGYDIDEVEKIQQNEAMYYQVELKSKGKKEINLVFSANGKPEKNIPYWD